MGGRWCRRRAAACPYRPGHGARHGGQPAERLDGRGEGANEIYAAKPANTLPDSRCLQLKDNSFYCLGAADRYAIETTSQNLLDARQQVAAQYAMLLSR
jgi:hypothetical protein